MKNLGINPAREPLPVRPAAHYTMGGIHQDIEGRVMRDDSSTRVEGLWAAGECGCVSVHGANRLGSNSLSHCIIWGRMTGEAAARHALGTRSFAGGDFGLPCVLVIKRLTEGERHDKAALNDVLRDHGAAT